MGVTQASQQTTPGVSKVSQQDEWWTLEDYKVEVQALPSQGADYTVTIAGHQGTTEWRFWPSPLVQVKLTTILAVH